MLSAGVGLPEADDAHAPTASMRVTDIRIDQLFLDGVYAAKVEPWLALAAAAMRDIREGRKPCEVPTVVVTQDEMQPWARGIIWDTRDPAHCVPAQRSTRDTTFAGVRQVDRAALRALAELLDWHDDDIVRQVGEGGVEARSGCDLTTVLAFHHKGLYEHVGDIDKIVRATAPSWASGGSSPPVRSSRLCQLASSHAM